MKELARNDTARAEHAFYRAYLIDPDDPFQLAATSATWPKSKDSLSGRRSSMIWRPRTVCANATIAFSSNRELDGKQVSQVAGNARETPMQVNRFNVNAMGLMMKDRAPEAEMVLRKALALDPKNPFHLKQSGYAL